VISFASDADLPMKSAVHEGKKELPQKPPKLLANETLYKLSYTPEIFPRQRLARKTRISSER